MYLFEEFAKFVNNDVLLFLLLIIFGFLFISSKEKRKTYFLYLFGVVIFTYLLKMLFFHQRICRFNIVECPESSSFPSGHSLVLFATTLFFYKDRETLLTLTIISVIIALTRIYLGVHNVKEVIAGFSFAVFYFSLWWKNERI